MRKLLLLLALLPLAGCHAPRTQHAVDTEDEEIVACTFNTIDRSCFRDQAVHFELGQSFVSAEGATKVATVAIYLKAHPKLKVLIEGFGDGQGTEEQNLELGDKRAGALQAELLRLGLDSDRVRTMSRGTRSEFGSRLVSEGSQRWPEGEFVLVSPAE